MFGFSMSEIIVIGIVVLVFVNPKDLPKFIYHIGKIYGQLQGAYQQMVSEFKRIENEVKFQMREEARTAAEKSQPVAPTPNQTGGDESVAASAPHQFLTPTKKKSTSKKSTKKKTASQAVKKTTKKR
jgi:Sec-independent protein translocase protein TatA